MFACAPEQKTEKVSDSEKFIKKLEHFSLLEEIAIDAMHPRDTMSKPSFIKALQKTALQDWVECVNLMDESEKFLLPPDMQELRSDLKAYANHRIQETQLYIRANKEGTNRYNKQIDSLHTEINQLMEKIRENRPPQGPSQEKEL